MELQGANVIITGAGSGIGRALAERFAQESPRALILADFDEEAVCGVAKDLNAIAVRTDVSLQSELEALVERARAEGGPVDLFCSNAGVSGPAGGPEVPDEEWQRIWEVNTLAHVRAARFVLPEMLDRGEGYLLNTASAAGLLTQLGALAYSVTKHAAVAVAEWLSITYRDRGIKVSCLCPQGVRTPMLEQALEDPVGAAALRSDELLEPAQVAEAALEGIREERFLILPHARVARHMAHKGADPERWQAGMRRLMDQGSAAGD